MFDSNYVALKCPNSYFLIHCIQKKKKKKKKKNTDFLGRLYVPNVNM